MPPLVIKEALPTAAPVRALIAAHLDHARAVTPPELVHAIDADRLDHADTTMFGAWLGADLVGIAALRQLDAGHGEIKSMHTAATARRRGVGRALVDHLLAVARSRGYRRVSLETGTMDAFEPSRRLYASAGFESCEPFADYDSRSHCMTIELSGAPSTQRSS